MPLTKGTLLGPYEITAAVGAGGMGEVYRARDTRLGRTVAIKVISADRSRDPKLRLRFEREAKLISSLSHPHICALYDIGEIPPAEGDAGGQGSMQYLVMQYLEGKTLAERLRRGPLPLDHVLRYGIEIADALATAHKRQILHRDLKPSNIMITRVGAVLLDFGLAKFLPGGSVAGSSPSGDEAVSDRLSSQSTDEKVTTNPSVLGTLDYMAPEQLEGKEPDARTDIFTLGVCLYEMATGRRPFTGSSRVSVIAAIMEHEPIPVTQYTPAIPQPLEWVIRTCLAKDPESRIQTAHDVMLQLQQIAEGESRSFRSPSPLSRPRTRSWPYWVLMALAIVLGVTGYLGWKSKSVRTAQSKPRRFSVLLPASTPLALPGVVEQFAVSPDGTHLVYGGGNDSPRLYLYDLATLSATVLPQTEGARSPFFSPNGEWIGFYSSDRELEKIPVGGGAPVSLTKASDLRGASWGGDQIAFAELWSPLRKVSALGGPAENLTPDAPQSNIRWPSFLPDGENILYTVSDLAGDYENAELAVFSLKTRKSTTVLRGATYGRYVPTGHLIYLHSGTVFAVRFDLNGLKVIGSPVPIINDADSYFASGLAHIAVTSDGSLFYIPRDPALHDSELVWVDRTGRATPVSPQRRYYQTPRLSPNGHQILVTVGVESRLDLWMYDIGRESWTRLTREATNEDGVWSPDGKQIVFASNRNRGFNLYLAPSDGSAPPRQMTSGQQWPFPTSWSPDAKAIAVVEQFRNTLTDIFAMSVDGKHESTPLADTRFNENGAAFSPDGQWIAYYSDESGQYEIYVQRYPGPGRKWLVSTGGGVRPVWRRDGRELFYREGSRMMAVDLDLQPEFRAGKPRLLFAGNFDEGYDVTPDGQHFLMVRRQQPSPRTQINVVLGALPR